MGAETGSENLARTGEEAMNDDPRDIEERFRKTIMARPPQERLAMACRMFATAKALVRAGIEKEHGLLHPDKLREHVFLRFYGQDFGKTERTKILDSWQVDRGSNTPNGCSVPAIVNLVRQPPHNAAHGTSSKEDPYKTGLNKR